MPQRFVCDQGHEWTGDDFRLTSIVADPPCPRCGQPSRTANQTEATAAGRARQRRCLWKRIIGIVGGLGPHAHIELERLILQATCDRLDRPPNDQDYPEWILSAIPATPDRTRAFLGEAPTPLHQLKRSILRLAGTRDAPGADFAVIACNTAHLYLDELRRVSPIPILDMIEETVQASKLRSARQTTIGLLATTGTLRADLYVAAANRLSDPPKVISLLDCSTADRSGEQLQEELVMVPIYGSLRNGDREGGGIKSGFTSPSQKSELKRPLVEAVRILKNAGATLVVLGCTELPLVLGRDTIAGVPLLDPLEVAAVAAVEIALGERPLP